MGYGMKTPKLCNIKRISARKTQLIIYNNAFDKENTL